MAAKEREEYYKFPYRGWLPTDMDAFFKFSCLVLFIKIRQTFQTKKNGLSVPVNLKASKRKVEEPLSITGIV